MDAHHDEAAAGIPEAWKGWIGETVVVDTDSQYIYLGRLTGVDETWVVMEDVDVHDVHESYATRERYLIEAADLGVKPTRKHVWLFRRRLVSLSRLGDVLQF
jgi:hypothetical protein